MLKDHGVRRTGKEGAESPALNAGSNKTGPDQRALRAKEDLRRRSEVMREGNPGTVVSYDWEADRRDYAAMEAIARRKYRGGATFSPGHEC